MCIRDSSVIIQALRKGLIEHEASDTGGVPRWKSSCPDRLAEATVWCRKVYSDSVVSHNPARIQGLSDMRRPQTASELMQFLQAANWLRTPLPRMAEVMEPLRVFYGTYHGRSFA